MTPSQTLLTNVKAAHGLGSDWQLHKIMGCSIQALRRFTKGERELSADMVLIACELLGEDPQPWLVRVELQRCPSDKRRQILERILARLESASDAVMAAFVAVLMLPFY